jgi:uncharacterized protein DUF4382
MRRFLRSARALWLVAGLFAIPVALASCGGHSSGTGTGVLSVSMAFQKGAAPVAGTAVTPLSDDGFGSSGRTPLADLIVSFNSVQAYSCPGDTMHEGGDDSTEAGEDSTGDHEGDSAHLQPLTEGDHHDGEADDDSCQAVSVLADSTITLSAAGLDTTLSGLIARGDVPAGNYDFLVLGITKALVVTQAGDTVEAKVPSGHIKVKSHFSVGEGGSTQILIVFDVNRSVVETPPGSLNFIVKPVLHSEIGWAEDHHQD